MSIATLIALAILGIGVGLWALRTLMCYLDTTAEGTSPCFPGSPEHRASALLRELLEEREYAQVLENGYLDVVSPTCTQRIYRIPRYTGLVTVYEQGRARRDLCVRPADEPLPSADMVLLHKLMIQANEKDYLACARQFPALLSGQRYRP